MSSGAVDVYVYGALRKRFGAPSAYQPVRARVAVGQAGTIEEILAAIGIALDEVSHLFLNGEYSAAGRRVRPDDRLAIFGKDMALLYRQYFPKVADAT